MVCRELIADIDPAVASLLGKFILILGETCFLTPAAHGGPPAVARRESVLTLLQSALQLLTDRGNFIEWVSGAGASTFACVS